MFGWTARYIYPRFESRVLEGAKAINNIARKGQCKWGHSPLATKWDHWRWHCCPVKPFYQHVHLWTLVHRGGSNHTRWQGPSHYVAGSHDYRHGALPLRPDALSACPRQGVSSNHTCLCDMLLSCILSGRLLAVSLHS